MIRRAALALLVIGVVIAALLRVSRERVQPLDRAQFQDDVAVQTPSVDEQTAVRDSAPVAVESGNLRAMSETFRNTTFLLAIRDAGFLCEDVVASYYGGGKVWTASCRDMRGYTINVGEAEELVVEPVVHYFDTLDPARPFLNDRFRLDLEPPLELFEQQRPK